MTPAKDRNGSLRVLGPAGSVVWDCPGKAGPGNLGQRVLEALVIPGRERGGVHSSQNVSFSVALQSSIGNVQNVGSFSASPALNSLSID